MIKKYQKGSIIPDFSYMTPWKGEKNFFSASAGKKQKTVLFFLRYYGCTVTKFQFHEITANCGNFFDAGAQLYVAMQSHVETVRSNFKEEDFAFEIICDPEGVLYRLFDIGYCHYGYVNLKLPTFPPGVTPPSQEYKDKLLRIADEANALGFWHGLYEGDEQQLPAIFILDENHKALFAHYAKDVVDLPLFDELLGYL
jgi:peroxiredoxin